MKKLYLSFYKVLSAKQIKQAAVVSIAFTMAALLPCKLLAQAPTISYSSPYTFLLNTAGTLAPTSSNVAAPAGTYGSATLLGTGMSFEVNGVAVDAAGNMYVNDASTSGPEVIYKIAADGSSTTIIGSGFVAQSGDVAVDGAGNVYVTDQSHVWKIPASGSPVSYGTPVMFSTPVSRPFGIACDAAGNLYVTNLNGGVYKMASDGSNAVRIDSGIGEPAAVAIDAAGNVYATDFSTGALYEIPANSSPQVQLATGFNSPRGLAVDAAGTIYVDAESQNGIYTVAAGGGTPVQLISALNNLVGLAVDADYNLYGVLQGTGGVSKFSPTGGYFISPVALPAGLSFDNTTGIISGTPTASSRPANYLVSAYNSSGGASTTVNIAADAVIFSYSTPQTYTAGTAITPLDPSITSGAVGSPGYGAAASTGSGFASPGAVAVDASGNVYVADAGNAAVKKIPAGGGSPVSIGLGFNSPTGVAVDGAGDVFVADPGSGLVSEVPVGGGSQVTLGSGFTAPYAIAVDQSGNVYVADAGTNTLYKIPAGNGTPIVLGAGFSELTAVAVDQLGNLYVVDGGASIVYEVSEKGGIPVSVGGSFSFPTGVAVDASGIVYVTDFDAGKVYKLSACGCTEVAIASGLSQPGGMAVDGAGNVYVANTGGNQVDEISPTGGYVINMPLPAGLKLNDTTGQISGKPKTVAISANYTITAWNSTGNGSTTFNITVVAPPPPAISYATPQTYTAGTAITALSPSSIGGGVAFPTYNDTPASLGSGFNSPFGVAVDASGNIYIADAGNSAVKEIPFGSSTPVSIGSGFDYPTGVAVDAAGDVFVADQGNSSVFEIPAGGGTQITLGSGFSAPDGVAVDASGNVYVTDETTNDVYEVPAGNGTPVVIASSFLDLTAITIDASGNLYIVDGGAGAVYELPKSGGVPTSIGIGFLYPTGVTVDPIGNIYVADGDANTIFKVLKNGFTEIPIANGFNEPGGVAVDGAGNLYVGDTNDDVVDEINPTGGYFINAQLPAGISLDSKTGIISGTPTAGSPATNYTITAYNVGGSSAALVNITVTIPPPPVISYVTPQSYPQVTAITPLSPNSTGVDVPSYSSTIGNVGSGFNFPYGAAVDKKGNVYVADAGNATVWELPVGGGPQFSIGSGFSGPVGVAVDTLGNVYVADGGASDVVEIPAGGGPQVFVGSAYHYPDGVAVDAAGNVYVTDAGTGKVYKVAPGHPDKTLFASGFSYPTGIAIDNTGNAYVADEGSGTQSVLYEIIAGSNTKTPVPYNFNLLTGVAADASGNLFAADGGVGKIIEFPAGGGSAVTISGLSIPYGMAVDAAGNLYAADIGTNLVDKITPTGGYYINTALPAGLTFNSTTGLISGTPTTPAPAKSYTVNAYNVGGDGSATVAIKILATNANLAHLTLSNGQLSPVFAAGTFTYATSVGNGALSIAITPTPVDPNASITVNGQAVTPGQASQVLPLAVGSNSIPIVVTAQDGTTTKTYTVTVNRAPSTNAYLSSLGLSKGAVLSPSFAFKTMSYNTSVSNAVASFTVTPATFDPNATITVNGSAVTSKTQSDPIALSLGSNTITVVVTAQDNSTTQTYTVTVNRPLSSNADLASIHTGKGYLVPKFAAATSSYNVAVGYGATSITITPTTADPTASVTVNGTTVTSGTASDPINLNVGDNTITLLVTAQDGTQKTYTLTVTRAQSNDAYLASMHLSGTTLSPDFAFRTLGYTASVPNTASSVTVTANVLQPNATFTVNTMPATPKVASAPIALAVGSNTINIVVTAMDGVTTQTYTVTVTRAAGSIDSFDPGISVTKPSETALLADDGLLVHQAVSPNGDGINDFLQIDNISQHPENKLSIMNRNGQLIYEASGYDNNSKVFDGHSNKNGQMQLPGTYFYQLDYTIAGITKHKTGFLVLKY